MLYQAEPRPDVQLSYRTLLVFPKIFFPAAAKLSGFGVRAAPGGPEQPLDEINCAPRRQAGVEGRHCQD